MKNLSVIIICCVLQYMSGYGQSSQPATVDIHLNKEMGTTSHFLYQYEFSGEGDNAVQNTVIETRISITLLTVNHDSLTYSLRADSKSCSNEAALVDGDALILYSLLGMNMDIICNPNGELLEVINKDSIFIKLTDGFSSEKANIVRRWLDNARRENEAKVLNSIFDLNYMPLLKYHRMEKIVPNIMESDSIIRETPEHPESKIITIDEYGRSGNELKFKTQSTINSKELIQDEGSYQIVIKPSRSILTELLHTDLNGLVKKLSIRSRRTSEGMIMKRNDEIMNESGSFTAHVKRVFDRI